MKHSSLIKVLCYSGVIPFYILSILSFFYKNFFVFDLFSIYSLVILSFLSGSTWLELILYEKEPKIKLLIVTVVLTPIILIIFEIFIQAQIKIFIFGICYFGIYLIDQKFIKNLDYIKIRKNLTIQVILCHILVLISIYTNGF